MMTRATQAVAMLAAGMLVVQPCAARDFQDSQTTMQQSSAFAGLTVRLPLGQAQRAKPTARLQFTMSQTVRDERTGITRTFKPQGLEIGGTDGWKPALYVNGQSTAELENRLNVGGTGTTVLIVGAVLVGVVVLVAAASAPADLLNPCNGDSDLCD